MKIRNFNRHFSFNMFDWNDIFNIGFIRFVKKRGLRLISSGLQKENHFKLTECVVCNQSSTVAVSLFSPCSRFVRLLVYLARFIFKFGLIFIQRIWNHIQLLGIKLSNKEIMYINYCVEWWIEVAIVLFQQHVCMYS